MLYFQFYSTQVYGKNCQRGKSWFFLEEAGALECTIKHCNEHTEPLGGAASVLPQWCRLAEASFSESAEKLPVPKVFSFQLET